MEHSQHRTFMQGALILVLSNILVKVIGALFKIPLARLLTEEGMAIFNTAYQVYAALFAVSTTGLPIAISKLVAESAAQKSSYMCQQIFKVSFIILGGIGLIGSLALYFFAPWISEMVHDRAAVYSMIAIAPALFFICIASCYRGFFQGLQNMKPTAVSQVIEALGKLMLGYGFAYLLMRSARLAAAKKFCELSYEWPAAGAILGITLGIVLSAFFLGFRYLHFVKHRGYAKMGMQYDKKRSSYLLLVKRLVAIAIPVTLGACVSSMTAIVDMVMIRGRLQSIAFTPFLAQKLCDWCGVSLYDKQRVFSHFIQTCFLNEKQARWLYGSYSGYAHPLFNLPSTVVLALSMSLVPAISSCLAAHNQLGAREAAHEAIRMTFLFSLPCAMVFMVGAEPVLQLVYKNTSSAMMLMCLAPACISVTVVSVATAVLQASGHAVKPVFYMTIGCMIKALCNYILIGNPYLSILGAPISTTISYTCIMLMDLYAVFKILKVPFSFTQDFARPLLAAVFMGVILWILRCADFFSINASTMQIVGSLGFCSIIYIIMLLIVRGMVKKDIEMLPKGKKIVKTLAKFKIID